MKEFFTHWPSVIGCLAFAGGVIVTAVVVFAGNFTTDGTDFTDGRGK